MGPPSKPVYFAWINITDSIIPELWKVQETWSSVLSEFAFWLWAEMDQANRECLTSQVVRGIWNVGCGCSSSKRYQSIRTCLTGEVESPSSPIRRQAPDVRYPEKVERRPDRIPPRVEWAMPRVARGTVCVCKGERVTWHFLGRIPQTRPDLGSEEDQIHVVCFRYFPWCNFHSWSSMERRGGSEESHNPWSRLSISESLTSAFCSLPYTEILF